MDAITIAMVDDHRVATRLLRSYVQSCPDLRVAGIAASGEELLEHLSAWQPQVVVQELLLAPGGIDGIETTRRVLAREPSVRVVALTTSADEARMMAALGAGATGYIRENAEPGTLLAAIRAVNGNKIFIEPFLARCVVEDARSHEALTDPERTVLRHLALGRSTTDMAAALAMSEDAIKAHVSHVLGKLCVENRAQALIEALKLGLVSLDELE